MPILLCQLMGQALAAPLSIDPPSIPVDGGEVQPFLSTQLRLTSAEEDDWAPRVRFRRVRTGFRGIFADGRLATSLQINLVPGSLELIDLYGEYLTQDVVLRVGQFTIPFTRYREQSHRSTLLVDFSMTTEVFGAERQMGIMLADRNADGWTASLGVFTGVNARASHAVALGDAFRLDRFSPSNLAFGRAELPIHPEIVGRVGLFTQGMDLRRTSHVDRTGTHVAGFLSAAVDLDPEPREDFVFRVAPEVLFQSGPFGGTAVFYAAWFDDGGSLSPAWTGLLVEGAWRFDDVWELAARGAGIFASDALLDAAPDAEEQMWEALIGVNAYLVGERLKFAGDFGLVVRDEQAARDPSPAARLQAQLAW